MAYFSRLIVICLFWFSGLASAVPVLVQKPAYWHTGNPSVYESSIPAAGQAAVEYLTWANPGFVYTLNGCDPDEPDGIVQCSWHRVVTVNGAEFDQGFPVYATCSPYGASAIRKFVSGASVCEFLEEPETECPPPGTTEGDSSNAYTTNSRVPANNLCIGSCSWSAGGVVPSVCANGKCYYYGPFTSNGTSCTGEGGAPAPEESDPAPPDDAQCVAKGQCPGTINGTKVCVPCSSKEGTTSESGSTSSEGTDSSGAPTGGTGSTNTTKETTANCTNGSCNTTTTTTVTNPDGSTTTTTETESKPQSDFCKANPGHIVCKGSEEGTFGGSCSSGFQCSGDAVQCAQA